MNLKQGNVLLAAIGSLTLALLYLVFWVVPPAQGLGNYVRIAFFHIPLAWVSAVYALFSFLTVPFLVFVIPRLFFSLHPSPVINDSGSIAMEPVMFMTLLVGFLDATLVYVWLVQKRISRENREAAA